MSDLDALAGARDGNGEAGRTLVERHGPSMLRTARSVLGRYAGMEADDVVQEALIAALTTPSPPVGDIGAWLRAIAVRKALDMLRRPALRREEPLLRLDQHDAPPPAGSEGGRLNVLQIRQALATLSPMDRAVLVLADLEGHSMAEVARIVGSTRVAVRLRASRARRKLARQLRSSGEAADRRDAPRRRQRGGGR